MDNQDVSIHAEFSHFAQVRWCCQSHNSLHSITVVTNTVDENDTPAEELHLISLVSVSTYWFLILIICSAAGFGIQLYSYITEDSLDV